MKANGRPWHLVAVGWLAILWTAFSAADYLLTRLTAAPYLALFTEAQVDYFTNLPVRSDLLWPVAVWSGLAGTVGLLGGLRFSAFLLGIAMLAMGLATLGLVFVTDPPMQAVTGPVGVWIMAGSTVVYLLLWLHARQVHAVGHLP